MTVGCEVLRVSDTALATRGSAGSVSTVGESRALFSEQGSQWCAVPSWADFLIELGRRWPTAAAAQVRRIALVSMPCDSAAAGLITLGGVIRDLSDPHADDLEMHYGALLRFAQQFVQSCRECSVRCNPKVRRCGHTSEATGMLRHKEGKRYTVVNVPKESLWGSAIPCSNSKETRWVLAPYASDWSIDGHPRVRNEEGNLALDGGIYHQLATGAAMAPANLTKSFSGLCLAGRAQGEAAAREVCESIRFQIQSVEIGLAELTTIHSWAPRKAVSRVSFFNARTGIFDRCPFTPALVVADGDASFLRVLRTKEFQRSDVIAVVPKTLDRDRLETVGSRLVDLSQWYAVDTELQAMHSKVPRGITLSFLRQR